MVNNFCFVIPYLPGGGAERVLITLANRLVEEGHGVHVVLFKDLVEYPRHEMKFSLHVVECELPLQRHLGPYRALPGFSAMIKAAFFLQKVLCKLPALGKLIYWQSAQRLREGIKATGVPFDVIVSHLPEADQRCIYAKLPNLYCCIHRDISMEMTKYTYKNTPLRSLSILVKRWFLRRLYAGQSLIAVSEGIQRDVLHLGIQTSSIQVIYNPFNIASIREKSQAFAVEESDYIISVGRIDPEKRHVDLIEAYARSGIREKLLIFGQGRAEEELCHAIKKHGLENQVILKGFHPNPYPYMKNAKALVLCSEMEGLPTVLIEALILGTPVVSTDCPSGPNEILTGKFKKFLSPVGDIDALAENIRTMVRSPVAVDESDYTRFSDEKIAQHYLALARGGACHG